MLCSACFIPVVDLLTALPCSNERVKLFNMQSGNRVNCGISSFVPSSFCGYNTRWDEDICRVISFSLCVILCKPFHLVQSQADFVLSKAERSECVYLLPLMFANILQQEQTSFGLNTVSPLMRGKAHVSQALQLKNPLLPSAANVLGFDQVSSCTYAHARAHTYGAALQYAFKWDY